MPTLYIVRHAPKAWNNGRKPNNTPGHQHDAPLADPTTATGLLATTIEQLRGVRLDGVYVSPFLRTRQTAQLILTALNTSNVIYRLEPDLGEYLGNNLNML